MDSRTQERVEQWDSRPFSGGYDGLSDLADDGFSGAVTAGRTWLFMLNGRIVGVVDGDIEAFDGPSGTVYQAPHPSLPLLYAMEERGGETRANYYTNETPLEEVDETLQQGSFTGYVELSENVLSGDYYAVYYGGRRMAAAYIGSAERLITGDEAFERAADEVGIYEVIDVEVDVTDVPGSDVDVDVGSDTNSDANSNSGANSNASSEPEPTAETGTLETDSELASSGIDPIDVSSSEPSVTIESNDGLDGGDAQSVSDAAIDRSDESGDSDEPAGITTAYDEAETDAIPSSGITDEEPAAERGAHVDVDVDTGIDTGADAGASAGAGADVDTNGEPDTAVEPAADVGSEPEPEPEAPAGAETETDTGTDSSFETGTSSGPDPAEVEAAAEQLGQNDISWTDDGGEDDDTETATADVDANSQSRSERRSEPNAEPRSEPRKSAVDDGHGATPADTDSDPDADADTEPTATSDSQLEERFEEEEQWRETRRIPSIDPETTTDGSTGGGAASPTPTNRSADTRETAESDPTRTQTYSGTSDAEAAGSRSQDQGTAGGRNSSHQRGQDQNQNQGSSPSSASTASAAAERTLDASAADQRIEKLSDRIERLTDQREALEAKNKELVSERDQLREENETLSETVEKLESRIETLKAELEQAQASAGGDDTVDASTELSPARALAGTNLFVRYDSKSQPTLERAHDGDADREEVTANLRLEHHTEFDAADVTVDGVPYEEFLTSTMAYRFVEWLTGLALYEIRDTGHANGLADLYDAIPRIDRAELDATISLEDDDTEDVPDQVTFDVVAFDKMGNPLVIATLNDSREPVTESTLTDLEAAASAVKANYPDLAATMAVTASYFEPGAFEVTEEATSSGLLSRGSKLSYVNLSRKSGYHLCLIESGSEGFHMNVPEL